MPYTYRKEHDVFKKPLASVQNREARQPSSVQTPLRNVPQKRSQHHTPIPTNAPTRVPIQRYAPAKQKPQEHSVRHYYQIVLGVSLIVLALIGMAAKLLTMNQYSSLNFSLNSSSAPAISVASQANKIWPKVTVSVNFPVKQTNSSVVALSQAAETSYNNMNPEWSQWSNSACSGCAMAAIMNAYGANINGRPLNCGDVLEVEYHLSVYRPANDWGLITGSQNELIETAAQFGFTGYSSQNLSLDNLISLANSGVPSIVRIPTHIMLLVGGDSQNVYLADSGGLHLTKVTRNQFLHGLPGSSRYAGESWMSGWYVLLTPTKK